VQDAFNNPAKACCVFPKMLAGFFIPDIFEFVAKFPWQIECNKIFATELFSYSKANPPRSCQEESLASSLFAFLAYSQPCNCYDLGKKMNFLF
jgi:hypothetical protein